MPYIIEFTEAAFIDLERLPKNIQECIIKKIEQLEDSKNLKYKIEVEHSIVLILDNIDSDMYRYIVECHLRKFKILFKISVTEDKIIIARIVYIP